MTDRNGIYVELVKARHKFELTNTPHDPLVPDRAMRKSNTYAVQNTNALYLMQFREYSLDSIPNGESGVPCLVHYYDKDNEHGYIHTWETSFPLDKDSLNDAVWATGLLNEGDDFIFQIEIG